MKTTNFTPILITPCIDRAYLQKLPLYAKSASWLMYRHKDDEFVDDFLSLTRPLSHKTLLLNLPFANPIEAVKLSTRFARFDGLHLKSHFLDFIAPLKSHFADEKIIGYSAHSIEEAKSALALGATYCTISPIYPSQNKGKPLGIESLRNLPKSLRSRIVALGGINKSHIKELESLGLFGFAGISYFLES